MNLHGPFQAVRTSHWGFLSTNRSDPDSNVFLAGLARIISPQVKLQQGFYVVVQKASVALCSSSNLMITPVDSFCPHQHAWQCFLACPPALQCKHSVDSHDLFKSTHSAQGQLPEQPCMGIRRQMTSEMLATVDHETL